MALRASRRWLSLGFLLLAGGLVVVTTLEQRLWPHMAAAAPRRPGLPEAVPRTYAQALADADRDVASAEVRAAQHPDEWTILESLSRRYSTRARLTGSFDDYA